MAIWFQSFFVKNPSIMQRQRRSEQTLTMLLFVSVGHGMGHGMAKRQTSGYVGGNDGVCRQVRRFFGRGVPHSHPSASMRNERWAACMSEPRNGGEDWRPHTVNGEDVQEDVPEEFPLELAEGYLDDECGRPRFDLDADEKMLVFKLQRALHKDDYKRIFDNPRVGGTT